MYKYPLGFALQIDERDGVKLLDNYFSPFGFPIFRSNGFHDTILSIDFRPRSSIYKTGMILANSCGTVDYSYRGEICAFFYHVMPNMP